MVIEDNIIDNIREAIKAKLSDKGELSTYQVAKQCGLSWNSANHHLLTMWAEGEITMNHSKGLRNRKMWRLV